MTEATDIPSLAEATDRLIRTAEGVCADPDALAAPSLLPGWSRAHVLAHLALNAEGLARLVEGVQRGEPATMYDSQEARDADIEELARADGPTLLERLTSSARRLDEALAALTDEQWDASAERTPGGATIRVRGVPVMRLTEVEVHHADLDRGYGPEDWPTAFSEVVLERFLQRPSPSFLARPDDIVRSWEYGECGDQPLTVSGPSWALAWWITGRGKGEHLTSSTGELPEIGAW